MTPSNGAESLEELDHIGTVAPRKDADVSGNEPQPGSGYCRCRTATFGGIPSILSARTTRSDWNVAAQTALPHPLFLSSSFWKRCICEHNAETGLGLVVSRPIDLGWFRLWRVPLAFVPLGLGDRFYCRAALLQWWRCQHRLPQRPHYGILDR